MLESLLNKLFFLTFFMSIFNVGIHIWEIVRRLRSEDGYRKKYEVSTLGLILLGLSISYLLSTIFVGIKL
jgi:hypothetical protein|tara:strand:+ start:3643 stop:3852 length:210 start_codon:yes stop_codon:yes gene_type:complete